MKHSNYRLIIWPTLVIALIFPFFILPSQPPAVGQLSEEERAMFDLISSLSESELEQLAHTIEDEVGKMTPEEQNKFWNEVDREAERLQPKIESYVKDQHEEIQPEEIIEKPVEQKKPPQPKPVVPKEKPADLEKKREVKNKVVQAQELIISILQSINTYLATTQALPDFADDLEDWDEDNKIKHWKSGLAWSFFKDQIQKLVHTLNILVEKDQYNNFKHLAVLVNEETPYNNLSQLERTLNKYVPQIEEIVFDIDELSPQSEQAMQGITAALYEAINILHIIGAIESVIAKYKPTAEELKKTEEEIAERARQEESIRPWPKPVVSVGTPEDSTGFVATPAYPTPSPTRLPGISERLPRPSGSMFPPPAEQPISAGKLDRGGSPVRPSGEKEKTTATGAAKPKAPTVPEKKEPTDKIADDYIKDMTRGLDASVVAIEDGKLGSIKNQTLNSRPYDPLVAEIYLPETIRQIRRASDAAKALELRIKKHFKGTIKAKYQKALKDEINLHKKTLEKVANQIRSLRDSEANIPDEKAYAYLGGLRKERVPEVAQRIPSPSSLYTLEDRIRDLLKIVK